MAPVPRTETELARAQEEIAFRTAFLVTRDASEAEEAVQDARVKAWRSLGRFRRGAPSGRACSRSWRTRR